jgi:hypothetical protein
MNGGVGFKERHPCAFTHTGAKKTVILLPMPLHVIYRISYIVVMNL